MSYWTCLLAGEKEVEIEKPGMQDGSKNQLYLGERTPIG